MPFFNYLHLKSATGPYPDRPSRRLTALDIHIDPQGQFYDSHAQPIAKEAALGHSSFRAHASTVNELDPYERKMGCAECAAQHSAVQAIARAVRSGLDSTRRAAWHRVRRSPLRFVVRSQESHDSKRDFLFIRDKHSPGDPSGESSQAGEQSLSQAMQKTRNRVSKPIHRPGRRDSFRKNVVIEAVLRELRLLSVWGR